MADATMQGRSADADTFWAGEGVWWDWGDGVWMIRPPCGHHFLIGGDSSGHEVDDNGDGTITVESKPGNSNSILCPRCGWHGYIDNGVWRSA